MFGYSRDASFLAPRSVEVLVDQWGTGDRRLPEPRPRGALANDGRYSATTQNATRFMICARGAILEGRMSSFVAPNACLFLVLASLGHVGCCIYRRCAPRRLWAVTCGKRYRPFGAAPSHCQLCHRYHQLPPIRGRWAACPLNRRFGFEPQGGGAASWQALGCVGQGAPPRQVLGRCSAFSQAEHAWQVRR